MRSDWDILPGPRSGRVRRAGIALAAAALLVPVVLTLASGTSSRAVPTASGDAEVASGPATPAPAPALPAERSVAQVPSGPASVAGPTTTAGTAAPVAARPASTGPEPVTGVGEPPKPDDVPGQWIVQLADGTDANAVASEHASEHDADVTQVYTAVVDGYAARMSDADAAAVADDPRVVSVIRDRMVRATVQSMPTGIPRSDSVGMATAVGSGGNVDVDVAVIDTGIDLNYTSELNISTGKNCVGSGNPQDGDGHGTHVAGTIGAKDNGNGVVGVAPGARLHPVKVLDNSGNGTWSQVTCGLDWVRQQGNIEVANMSLGGGGSDSTCNGVRNGIADTLHEAVCDLVASGTTVVVAAGNDGKNAANFVPSAYDEVITVSALADYNGLPGGGAKSTCASFGSDDSLANFSNYGSDVDIIAPGVCILSTWKGGGTRTISGTSMATPHVTGAAADYLSQHPGATPAQVKQALQANGNFDWTGDKDNTQEPLLDLAFLGGAGLPAGGGGGGGGGSTISLTVTPGRYDSNTSSKAKLAWSGATGTNVDIYQGGAKIKTTANDGDWTDKTGQDRAGQSFVYKVCQAGSTTACSDEVTGTYL